MAPQQEFCYKIYNLSFIIILSLLPEPYLDMVKYTEQKKLSASALMGQIVISRPLDWKKKMSAACQSEGILVEICTLIPHLKLPALRFALI